MASANRDRDLTAGGVVSHLGVMLAVSALVGLLVAGIAIPFAALAGLGARAGADSLKRLPADLTTAPLAQRTKILDVNGKRLATWYDQNRVNVGLDDVSLVMRQAIVSIEDYRFYQHGALDLKGTLRALITNQASGGVVQGGSSITQQMVKLTLVQQAHTKAERAAATDDSYARKIRELRYAIAFEQHYSKDWILERYLNLAYFGDGAFGIQAAARHYFNVNAKDLDLRQSALLAGLVRNPTGYDPTNNKDAATNRRNTVLDRMAELSVISHKKADKTKKMPLGLDVQPSDNGCVNSLAPFYCDYVLNYLWHDKSLGKTVDERKKLIKSGGLTIKTPIDLRFQKAADASVKAHVYPTDQAIGGLAMVEPGTGDLKALSQSRPMGRDDRYLVQFEGIADREGAERLRGANIEAEPVEVPGTLWVHELIGARVRDATGAVLGLVASVEANPASDLLVLESGALIPVRFVTGHDAEAGIVDVDIPDGLLEL